MNVSDVKMTDEDSFLSNSMMIKVKNIIMKDRIWINGVINDTTVETHCEATGHFPPVRQCRNVDDCRVHKCGPTQGVQDCTCECPKRACPCSSRGTQLHIVFHQRDVPDEMRTPWKFPECLVQFKGE